MVASGELGDAFAHLLHHAGALVPEHERQRQRDRSGNRREVGMAHAAGGEAHRHLAALGRIEVDLFNDYRFVVLAAESRFRLAWHRAKV